LADGDPPPFVKITSKTLPAGSWAVWGIANFNSENETLPSRDTEGNAYCELRNDNNFVASAGPYRFLMTSNDFASARAPLAMFGGVQALAGGSEVSLWCNSQFGANEAVTNALIMAVTLGGFQ
jgi:hypothetical protein